MEFVIPPPSQSFLPVRGSKAVFPVHRVYCVGRNYAAHAIEMGGIPAASRPSSFRRIPTTWIRTESFLTLRLRTMFTMRLK